MTILVGAPPLFGIRRPIEFVSSTQAFSGSETDTIAAPAGIQAGDLLVMSAHNRRENMEITGVPSGWVEHLNEGAGVSNSAHLYTKVATGSEPASYSWTFSNSRWNMCVMLFRNATGVDLIGARTRASTNTSTGASITPTRNGLFVFTAGIGRSVTVATPPAGMDLVQTSLSSSDYTAAWYIAPGQAGAATGVKTVVWNNTQNNVGWLTQIY